MLSDPGNETDLCIIGSDKLSTIKCAFKSNLFFQVQFVFYAGLFSVLPRGEGMGNIGDTPSLARRGKMRKQGNPV